MLTTDGLVNIVDLVKTRARHLSARAHVDREQGQSKHPEGRVRRDRVPRDGQVRHLGARDAAARLPHRRHAHRAGDRSREPSQKPETWNIGPLVRVAVVLGVLTLIEALGLLAFGWRRFGLSTDAGLLQTFTFQTFLFFALSSLVSVRERRAFWRSRPSAALAASLAAAAVVGTSSASTASPSSRRSRSPRARSSSATPRSARSVRTISSSPSSAHAPSAFPTARRASKLTGQLTVSGHRP